MNIVPNGTGWFDQQHVKHPMHPERTSVPAEERRSIWSCRAMVRQPAWLADNLMQVVLHLEHMPE
jgi:hypothetical protein